MFVVEKTETKTFDFQIKGSKKTYHVPLFSGLPVDTVLKLNDLNKEDVTELEIMKVIKDIFDEFAPGATSLLKTEEFAFVFKAYIEANEVPLGE